MEQEFELYQEVKRYLEHLGYPTSSILFEYQTPHANRLDMVIKSDQDVLVAIELKKNLFLNTPSNEDLGYHPIARQLQKNAEELGAKYYLLSDGEQHIWMQTGKNGRPEVTIEVKYSNFNATTLSNAEFTKAILFHTFEYIKNFPITGDSLFDCSIVLYLRITQEIRNIDNIKVYIDEILGREYLYEKKYNSYSIERVIAEVLERLKVVNLIENRNAVLEFIDEHFEVYGREWIVPRWLADFMVRLLLLRSNDRIVDLFTRNGNLTSAAYLNEYENVVSYYSNQKEIFWIKIQQLLGAQQEAELRFEPGLLKGELTVLPKDFTDGVLLAPPFNLKFGYFQDSHLAANGIKDSNSLYLEAAYNSLRKGGKLVAIVMDGFLLSSLYTRVRSYFNNIGTIEAIISLPPDTFRPYSAVKTSLLVIKKGIKSNSNTFFASLEEVPKGHEINSRNNESVNAIISNFERDYNFDIPISKSGFIVNNLNTENFHFSKYWFERQHADSANLDSNFIAIPLKQLVVTISRGSAIVNDPNDGSIPFISPASIRGLSIKMGELSYTSKVKLPRGKIKKVEENEVVVNIIGPYRGKAALVTPDLIGLPINRHLIAIKPNLGLITPGYLAVALNSKYVQEQFLDKSAGAVIQSLNLKSFEEIYLPVPSIEEQIIIYKEYSILLDELTKIQTRANEIEGVINIKLGKLGKEGGKS